MSSVLKCVAAVKAEMYKACSSLLKIWDIEFKKECEDKGMDHNDMQLIVKYQVLKKRMLSKMDGEKKWMEMEQATIKAVDGLWSIETMAVFAVQKCECQVCTGTAEKGRESACVDVCVGYKDVPGSVVEKDVRVVDAGVNTGEECDEEEEKDLVIDVEGVGGVEKGECAKTSVIKDSTDNDLPFWDNVAGVYGEKGERIVEGLKVLDCEMDSRDFKYKVADVIDYCKKKNYPPNAVVELTMSGIGLSKALACNVERGKAVYYNGDLCCAVGEHDIADSGSAKISLKDMIEVKKLCAGRVGNRRSAMKKQDQVLLNKCMKKYPDLLNEKRLLHVIADRMRLNVSVVERYVRNN